tara:strand:+ start:2715 stop:2975 length:261 start_codon:yes stop_codon:yes gene_type:complete
MTTKKAFFAEADRLSVEVDVSSDYDGSRVFSAYGPAGKQFVGSACHTTTLGDYEKGVTPNWKWMIAEIQQDECQNGEGCDYCHPED